MTNRPVDSATERKNARERKSKESKEAGEKKRR